MNFLDTNSKPQYPQQYQQEKPKFTVTKVLLVLSVFVLVGCAGAAFYFYKQWNSIKGNPNKVAEDQTNALVDSVGKLILLPTGETPSIASVTDPSKLKDQPFFANSKSGDKVLVYEKARMAYLYRPDIGKLINVVPINPDAAAASSTTNSNTANAQTSGSTTAKTNSTSTTNNNTGGDGLIPGLSK